MTFLGLGTVEGSQALQDHERERQSNWSAAVCVFTAVLPPPCSTQQELRATLHTSQSTSHKQVCLVEGRGLPYHYLEDHVGMVTILSCVYAIPKMCVWGNSIEEPRP